MTIAHMSKQVKYIIKFSQVRNKTEKQRTWSLLQILKVVCASLSGKKNNAKKAYPYGISSVFYNHTSPAFYYS